MSQKSLTLTPHHRGIHRLAVFLSVWTVFVVWLGALTKSIWASLAIPEPVTFAWMPQWFFEAKLREEYGHRIFAGLLLLSTWALLAWVIYHYHESRLRLVVLALAAALLVTLQAVVGALTVHFGAAAFASIPHAVIGQSYFCLIVSLAVVTAPAWMSDAPAAADSNRPSVRRLAVICAILLFVQLLLGSALRHDNQDAPLKSGNQSTFILHLMAHIFGAVAVVAATAFLIARVFRKHREQPGIFRPVRVLMMLLGVQFALGMGAAALKMLTYQQASPPLSRAIVATSHVVIGAIMLALSVTVALRAYRFTDPACSSSTQVSGSQPAESQGSGSQRMIMGAPA